MGRPEPGEPRAVGAQRGGPLGGRGWLIQDPGVHFLVSRVTPASSGFQAAAVEDRERAAAVADQLAPAQRTGGSSNACTAHAQHEGEEFVRDLELIGVGSITPSPTPQAKPAPPKEKE